MKSDTNGLRAPGDGADRQDHHSDQHGYVYVARSRRAGGLSLGIDLTPQGHCSFSCIYCQASHPPVHNPNLVISLPLLRSELTLRLASPIANDLRDLVFAGAGEPTAATNFDAVVDLILEVCRKAHFERPRRVFTNGRHLDRTSVADALVRWVDGGGEVWVKLDGASDRTLSAINGRDIEAATHLANLWRLAKQRPLGLQTMLLEGPELPTPEEVACEVAEAIAQGLAQGAKLISLHLLTIARVPSDPVQAARLVPLSDSRLKSLAQILRDRTPLHITVFGAP